MRVVGTPMPGGWVGQVSHASRFIHRLPSHLRIFLMLASTCRCPSHHGAKLVLAVMRSAVLHVLAPQAVQDGPMIATIAL